MTLIPVRCGGRRHSVRVEVERGRPQVVTSTHDEERERVLVALGGKAPRCLVVADGVRRLAAEVGGRAVLQWAEAGVHTVDALQAWRAVGAHTPDDVIGWAVVGERTPKAVAPWVRAGVVRGQDAARWIDAGVTSPLEARAWREAGVSSPGTVVAWRDVDVVDPAACGRWRRLTRLPDGVLRWQLVGVSTPEEAEQWGRAGVRTIADLGRWQALGIEAPDALEWTLARIPVEDVSTWRAAGVVDGIDARRWRDGGARSPEDVRGWRAAGVGSQDVGAWHDCGCRGPEDLGWWDSFGLLDAARFWSGVNGPEDVIAWRAVGVTEPETARRWMRAPGFVAHGEVACTDDASRHAFRESERVRLGLDDEVVSQVGDRTYFRADWRRVRPEHADLVSVGGDPDWWEWLPRRITEERVDMTVECAGDDHRLVAVRSRRGWVFESEHPDLEAERVLLALGAQPPRCAAAAEAFKEAAKHLDVHVAARWAETGAVSPQPLHFMQQWKIDHRPLAVREVVRMVGEGKRPLRVGDRFDGHKLVVAYVPESVDVLATGVR